jgi:hypothetical protein
MLKNRIAKAFRTPLDRTLQKVAAKSGKYLKAGLQISLDRIFDTRFRPCPCIKIGSYVNEREIVTDGLNRDVAVYLSDMYLAHRFDLLGSGWIRNSYDSTAPGLEGHRYDKNVKIPGFDPRGKWFSAILIRPHRTSARNIWQMVDSNYVPIDWQKDYKSGYRWDARKWYKTQGVPWQPGVDIKEPWELARMQHLPQMALFARVLPEYRDRLIREFRNQVLDFVATNPPRMGVNWQCTMDAGIRIANMLLAYDLFRQQDRDHILDGAFTKIIRDSVYDHGLHIVNNLEWSEALTSNHYLANIAGLLFVGAYLEGDARVDGWLLFAVREMIDEVQKQFNEDGTNFEASTCYHRLSGEMAVYATALMLGIERSRLVRISEHKTPKFHPKAKLSQEALHFLNNGELPSRYICRILKAGKYTHRLTKPTGEVPQIGDNDSGRFFRLTPVGEFLSAEQAKAKYENLKAVECGAERYWDENVLKQETFVAAAAGLFEDKVLSAAGNAFPLERSMVRALSKGKRLMCEADHDALPVLAAATRQDTILSHKRVQRFGDTIAGPPLTDGLEHWCYPDSGGYIFASKRLHLTISAGPNGQNGNGGHAHNDKLSFELAIDGQDIALDPGTYLYSSLPSRRNEFRSVHAHHTVCFKGMEQNTISTENSRLFTMPNETTCNLLRWEAHTAEFEVRYRAIVHRRKFEIADDAVIVVDQANQPIVENSRFGWYSNGYGKVSRKP